MSLAAVPLRIVPLLDIAPPAETIATDADPETRDADLDRLDADLDTTPSEALSRAVIALIATAALALSAVCTTLLLTFASTSIAPPALPDGTPASSVFESIHG